jgi:MFS family permease
MSAISAPTEREPDTAPGDELARLGSRVGLALIAATVLASGVASYDAYVVNVAVPAIGRDLGADVAAIQWTLTSYLLGVAGVAVVPVLIGVGAGSSLAGSLTHGYRPAMIVIGVVCAAGAVIAWLFVSDERGTVPALAAPDRGCALAVVEREATS